MTTPMTQPHLPPPPPPPPSAARAGLDVSGTPPIPFWRQVRVEFRKSYDTRAGMWMLIAIGIVVAIVELFVLVATLVQDATVYYTDFLSIGFGITSVLLPVLAIMLVTAEWSQRAAMVSFSLEPRRVRVVLAKWVVAICWVAVTIVVMALVALVLTAIASVANPDTTHWTGASDGAPAFWPSVVNQVLTMTIGFSFGALLLNTPGAIVLFFVYWYLVPIILAAVGSIRPWLDNALEWINFRLVMGPVVDGDAFTHPEWGKILTSGLIWIVLPLGFGIWRILRAEVK